MGMVFPVHVNDITIINNSINYYDKYRIPKIKRRVVDLIVPIVVVQIATTSDSVIMRHFLFTPTLLNSSGWRLGARLRSPIKNVGNWEGT